MRPLRMGPSKAPQKCFGFFQAAQFEFLRELLETPYLKISYLKNIWFFTVTKKKKVYCSFSVKHGEVSVMLEVQRKYKKFSHV